MIYFSEGKDIDNRLDENSKFNANNAFHLLNGWDVLPGSNDKNELDEEKMNDCIIYSRKLAEDNKILKPVDSHIGKILAKHKIHNEKWPDENICKILENLNSEEINTGFHVQTFNNLGVKTRNVFEGGTIEKEKSNYYEKQSQKIKYKYPNTSKLIMGISRDYKKDAKWMDNRANRDELDSI